MDRDEAEQLTKIEITAAQGRALERLFDKFYYVGDRVVPTTAFPHRDNIDNGARRCLRRLGRRGVLDRLPGGALEVTPTTIATFQEWEQKTYGEVKRRGDNG